MARTMKHQNSYKGEKFHEDEMDICDVCGQQLNVEEMKIGVCKACMNEINNDYLESIDNLR